VHLFGTAPEQQLAAGLRRFKESWKARREARSRSRRRSDIFGNGYIRAAEHIRLFSMSIIGAIIIGLLVGIVAKLLTPGRDPGGWIITILIGLAGSFVAGFLARSMGWYQDGQPVGFLASVVGAVILLVLYRLIARRN